MVNSKKALPLRPNYNSHTIQKWGALTLRAEIIPFEPAE